MFTKRARSFEKNNKRIITLEEDTYLIKMEKEKFTWPKCLTICGYKGPQLKLHKVIEII